MADSFGPDNLPDEEVSKKASTDSGISAPGDFGDLPVSPVGSKSGGSQKNRMGYNADSLPGNDKIPGGYGNLANAASGEGSASDKAQEAGRQALKSAATGGEGGMPGGKGLPGGSGPVTKGDKEAEAKKGNAEKNVDAAAEAAASYFGTPVAGAAVEKLGGVRGVTKKAGIGLLAVVAILALPILFIAYLLNGGALRALAKIATDPAARHFAEQAVVAYSGNNGFVATAAKISDAILGEADYHGGNTAIAAQPAKVTIEPGSTLDKFSKIDWSKAKWNTLDNNTSCPYDLVTKVVVNQEGKTRSIPDYVLNKTNNQHIPLEQLSGTAAYCVQNEYPAFNLFVRQPVTRGINKLTDVHLSYAAPKDSKEVNGDNKEVDKYVYDKTLNRVTPKIENTVDLSPYNSLLKNIADQYNYNVKYYNTIHPNDPLPVPDPAKDNLPDNIRKMFEKMTEGTSPYEINVQDFFNIPVMETPKYPNDTGNASGNVAGTGLAATLCPFIYTFADLGPISLNREVGAKNARAAIETRLAASQRAVMKYLTLTDTREANQLNTNENNASLQQVDNWASSTGYQLNVYNQLSGVQMNPEGTSSRAYNVTQRAFYDNSVDPNLPLNRLKGACYIIGIRGDIIQSGDEKGKVVDAQRGVQANNDMINAFADLKKQIVKESPGVFTSTTDFGIEQVMTGFIRTDSATANSGLEPGPDNFNRQMMGISQLSNTYSLSIGGRFLNDTEAKDLALREENTRRDLESKNGIAYRLFNTNNTRSLASIIQHNTTSSKTAMTAMISLGKQLLNPLQSLATINSGLNYYALGTHNTAFAADVTSNSYFKIDTAAMPPQDQQLDILANAKVIEDIKKNGSEDQKRKLSHYDECFKNPPPTSQYFNIQQVDKTDDQGKVDPEGHKYNFFTFFPDKKQEVDKNNKPVNDDPDSEYNKYLDCRNLFVYATDFNNPDHQLAIRYRVYVYNNAQLDLLDKLSSDQSDNSIYAGGASGGGSLENNGQVSTNFIWPVEEPYGISRCTKGHGFPAVDIYFSGKETAKIYAVADGEVAAIRPEGQSGGYGNFVILKHKDGIYTAYAHNKEILVQNVGDQVKQGDVIAIGDTTGQSTGPHLHFEVRKDGVDGAKQNPGDYLPDKANIKSICSQ